MVDWQGFLKWSLNYHDNTKDCEIIPLNEEQKKFLEDAVKSYCIDEVKRMKEILSILEKDIKDQDKHEQNVNLLNELIGLLAGIDNAKNFCKIGGVYFILKYAQDKDLNDELRNYCCIILVDCASNNQFVQNFLLRVNFWKILECFPNSSWLIRLRTISALGAMVRGHNLIMKRILLKYNGFSILLQYLKECYIDFEIETDKKIKTSMKILTIIDDLLKFQIFLDRDIDYLEDQTKIEKYPKVNKYSEFTNFSYQHSMTLLKILNKATELLLQDLKYKYSNSRVVVIKTFKSFLRECIRQKALRKKHFKVIIKYIKQYENKLKEEFQKDDFYENELIQVQQIEPFIVELHNQLINNKTFIQFQLFF